MRIRYNISTADYAKTHDASYNKGAAKGMLNKLIYMNPRPWGILLFWTVWQAYLDADKVIRFG